MTVAEKASQRCRTACLFANRARHIGACVLCCSFVGVTVSICFWSEIVVCGRVIQRNQTLACEGPS
ncbi:hypothetical protein PILCRDRAFT_255417 [Piloderma croceum F 1598]|uniref:Uncharacterized protein n=1 Tax=Piloderma croceum (strain F 1598) TaxID=765440 RepID=A0A0C3GCL2_PILCF|nr:hypothetical protein PILCRDRAFT_255417 [Piloderma croceum F 1598]